MSNIDRGSSLPALGQPGDVFILTSAVAGERVYVWSSGAWELQTKTSAQVIAVFGASPKLTLTEAPADGDINASECFIWSDDTDGDAAINFKGKSADGTVVAGTVALT